LNSNLKIVVTSKSFSNNAHLVAKLRANYSNIQLNDKDQLKTKEQLTFFLKDADAAIVGLDPIDSELLRQCPKLKSIAKYGVGLNNIDQQACKELGVQVGWTGGVNRISVAEMAIGFMLALSRNLFFSSYKLKSGEWKKDGGFQLTGKTVGIIGCGHIGKEVIKMLKPFNCKVLVNDIVDQTEFYKENGVQAATKEEIFESSNIITVHTPLDPTTENLFNYETFKKCTQSPYIINTARGGIIHEEDVLVALEENLISGVAIDSYINEPLIKKELYQHPQIITTPHIGGNAAEAVIAMGEAAINNLVKLTSQEE
jgi:phosphoglycerate dehydrogenase-like enzyme